jgi:hypothetical protein
LVDIDVNPIRRYYSCAGFDFEALLKGACYVLQPATFINRLMLEHVGFLDETLHYGMDLEYWLRVAKVFPVVFVDLPLANYRWYDAVKTNHGFRRWVELWGIYQRYTNDELTPGLLLEFFSILKKDFVQKTLCIDVKELADKGYEYTCSAMQKSLKLKDSIPQSKGIIFPPPFQRFSEESEEKKHEVAV